MTGPACERIPRAQQAADECSGCRELVRPDHAVIIKGAIFCVACADAERVGRQS